MTKDCMGNVIYTQEELASMGALPLIEIIPPDLWEETDIDNNDLISFEREINYSSVTQYSESKELKIFKIDSKYYDLFKFISKFAEASIVRELRIFSSTEKPYFTSLNNEIELLTMKNTKDVYIMLFKDVTSGKKVNLNKSIVVQAGNEVSANEEKLKSDKSVVVQAGSVETADFPKKGDTIYIELCSIFNTIVDNMEF